VVPGVSGGTMAFILGIYEDLINALRSLDLQGFRFLLRLDLRRFSEHVSWRFLSALGIGILAAVFTLARGLSWLLVNHPVLLWSFFMGLILASALSVLRRVETWQSRTWICLLCGIAAAYLLVGLVPVSTPNAPWFLFLSGAIAICAMILPGISGSFILVLLGKYEFVLEAVNQRNVLVLVLVASGAFVGLMAVSRLLGWLLKHYHDLMVTILAGIMLGSLRKVWPWKETVGGLAETRGKLAPLVQHNTLPSDWGPEAILAVCVMILGLLTVLALDRAAHRKS